MHAAVQRLLAARLAVERDGAIYGRTWPLFAHVVVVAEALSVVIMTLSGNTDQDVENGATGTGGRMQVERHHRKADFENCAFRTEFPGGSRVRILSPGKLGFIRDHSRTPSLLV